MSHTDTHHSFSVEVAIKFGLEKALLIHHFQHWIKLNRRKKSEKHFKEGRWWTYQTRLDMTGMLPYFTEEGIKHHIEGLVSQGVLLKGNFNKSKMDKTNWYSFVDEKEFLGEDESSNNVYERGKPLSTGENPHRVGENPQAIPDPNSYPKEEILRISKKRKKVSPLPKAEREPGVMTTDYEHSKLLEKFGAEDLTKRYIAVARWKGNNGVAGGDDYAMVRNWALREEKTDLRASLMDENKKIAQKVLQKFPKLAEINHLQLQDKAILFCYGNCWDEIPFTENGFKDRVFSRLRKMNLQTEGI